jgi:4-amino-4-deoxy-L-arabinose transferase-like glycosyltransferase
LFWYATLGIALLGFLLSAWTAVDVFDRLPHVEDEVAFLFQAKTIAGGALLAPAPAQPESFTIPFIIVRDGYWFGKYTPGYPLLLSLGELAGASWLLNPALAAACLLLVAVLGRRLYGPLVGLLAAALLVPSPFFLLQAGSLLSHVAGLFWVLLALLAFSVAWRRGVWWASLGLGAALGMLFLTRPLTGLAVAVPFVLVAGLELLRRPKTASHWLFALAGGLPFGVALPAYNHFTTGHLTKTAYELWWPYDTVGFGPDNGPSGHTLAKAQWNTEFNLGTLFDMLYGWPDWAVVATLALAAFGAVAGMVRHLLGRYRKQRAVPLAEQPAVWDLFLFAIVASLVVGYLFYWAAGQMYGPRYYFEAVGALALLSARGLTWMAAGSRVLLQRLRLDHRWAPVLGALPALTVAAGLTLWGAVNTTPRYFDTFRDWNGITRDQLQAVEAANLDNAVVIVDAPAWTIYAPFFIQNSPWLDTSVVYARNRGPERDARLMEHYAGRTVYRFSNGELSELSSANERTTYPSPLRGVDSQRGNPLEVTSVSRHHAKAELNGSRGDLKVVPADRLPFAR